MKQKHNSAEKSRKKKFHPLRRQIEFWFIGLLLLSMVITTVINGLFLEHYYISKKNGCASGGCEKSGIVEDDNGF